tara:strand:+ start:353 stop:490 length:138 start_codon:yes stop_codon:yes gene_type:complete
MLAVTGLMFNLVVVVVEPEVLGLMVPITKLAVPGVLALILFLLGV